MKSVSSQLPAIDRDEVQLGKSMIFVRKPESFFSIEKLRETKIGDFVVKIQRLWRKYFGRKEFVVLQLGIAKLYAQQNKFRRRDSIFRPYNVSWCLLLLLLFVLLCVLD